jgi:hypothetical protein
MLFAVLQEQSREAARARRRRLRRCMRVTGAAGVRVERWAGVLLHEHAPFYPGERLFTQKIV